MSGGSFNYAFCRVIEFVEELQRKIKYGRFRNYSPEVIAKLQGIAKDAERTAQLMREAEWLYSGDTSEDDFLERVAEIESGELVAR